MERQEVARTGGDPGGSAAAMDGWRALAREVVAARVAVGYQTRVMFAHAAHLGVRTVSDIENARRASYDVSTLAAVDNALKWPPGRAAAIAYGSVPPTFNSVQTGSMARSYQADSMVFEEHEPEDESRDSALIKVMRSDLPDETKRKIVRMLIAERDAARRRREALAADLIKMFREADA